MPGLISTLGQIWLSVAPVDLRRGIDGLSALVEHTLGHQVKKEEAEKYETDIQAKDLKIQALILDWHICGGFAMA